MNRYGAPFVCLLLIVSSPHQSTDEYKNCFTYPHRSCISNRNGVETKSKVIDRESCASRFIFVCDMRCEIRRFIPIKVMTNRIRRMHLHVVGIRRVFPAVCRRTNLFRSLLYVIIIAQSQLQSTSCSPFIFCCFCETRGRCHTVAADNFQGLMNNDGQQLHTQNKLPGKPQHITESSVSAAVCAENF